MKIKKKERKMSTVKKYSLEYKKEAIKLAKEIGITKAGLELGV